MDKDNEMGGRYSVLEERGVDGPNEEFPHSDSVVLEGEASRPSWDGFPALEGRAGLVG